MDGLNQSDIRHCTSGTHCNYKEIYLILIFNVIYNIVVSTQSCRT